MSTISSDVQSAGEVIVKSLYFRLYESILHSKLYMSIVLSVVVVAFCASAYLNFHPIDKGTKYKTPRVICCIAVGVIGTLFFFGSFRASDSLTLAFGHSDFVLFIPGVLSCFSAFFNAGAYFDWKK